MFTQSGCKERTFGGAIFLNDGVTLSERRLKWINARRYRAAQACDTELMLVENKTSGKGLG